MSARRQMALILAIVVVVSLALLGIGVTQAAQGAPAAPIEQTWGPAKRYMTTPCASITGVNCYWDAPAHSAYGGHSFYSIPVGGKVCIQFWENWYNRLHGYCRKR